MTLPFHFKYLLISILTLGILGCGGEDKDQALNRAYQAQAANYTVLEILENDAQFSTLVAALKATNLDVALAQSGRKTLFAPTNSAFNALGENTVNALLQDPKTLKNILLYHLLPESEVNAFSALKAAGTTLASDNGILLSVNRSDQRLFINGIEVTDADNKATNGVLHTINKVLLPPSGRSVEEVKSDILVLAESYKGIEDTDFTLSASFEPLLAELLTLAPQVPVAQRIGLVAQPWKQVWGPYDYNSGQQGVNPNISPDEIFQVIFEDGYYYNVTPLTNAETGEEQIGMLRGQFVFDSKNDQCLNVQFTQFPGLSSRPADLNLWQLPELQEAGVIEMQTGLESVEIVPDFVVRLFFGGGTLCEVYTDETMRISISTEDDNPYFTKLYILTKVES